MNAINHLPLLPSSFFSTKDPKRNINLCAIPCTIIHQFYSAILILYTLIVIVVNSPHQLASCHRLFNLVLNGDSYEIFLRICVKNSELFLTNQITVNDFGIDRKVFCRRSRLYNLNVYLLGVICFLFVNYILACPGHLYSSVRIY